MTQSLKTPIRRRALLVRTSCLSGAAAATLLLAPSLAAAQDACGPMTSGSVVCAPDAPVTGSGVTYGLDAPAPPQDLTVVLTEGLVIDTTGTTNNGVSVTNTAGGSVTVSGAGTTITTDGDWAIGAKGVAVAGNVTLDLGDVSTLGERADGIFASTNYGPGPGDIAISAGTVSTAGYAAVGVRAESQEGDITIHASQIVTSGAGGDGVYAAAHYGDVAVNVDYLTTVGDGGRGVTVYAQGAASVSAVAVYTFGQGVGTEFDAGAIKAAGTSVNIDVGQVVTAGDYAVAVYASSNHVVNDPTIVNPDLNIDVGRVFTRGAVSDAIVAINDADGGKINIRTDVVSTQGDYAFGVYAKAYGDIAVDAGKVTTTGTVGKAIDIVGLGGDIDVKAGAIATSGIGASGISTLNYDQDGKTAITITSVKTTRDYAGAIRAEAYGDVAISAGSVATSGFNSLGVSAISVLGDIDVKASDVTTHGAYASGVDTVAYGGTTSITVGTVVATGDHSAGVYARGHYDADGHEGGVTIHADTVTTSGLGGLGVGLRSSTYDGSESLLTARTITTSGAGASGLEAGHFGGKLTVAVDKITTTGGTAGPLTSTGASLDILEGQLLAHFGEVSTAGANASGIAVASVISDAHLIVDRGVTTTGDFSSGVRLYQGIGNTLLDLNGAVSTAGAHSRGLVAESSMGKFVLNALGSITTSGDDSAGIDVSLQSMGRGPLPEYGETKPYIYDSTAQIIANQVTTTGSNSDGIRGATGHMGDYADSPIITHNISVKSGVVTVSGQDSRGIVIDSLGSITVDAGATSSAQSNAIALSADTLASLNIRGATVSKATDAVTVEGRDVTVTIAAGGGITGAVNGLVLTALGEVPPTFARNAAFAAPPIGKITLTNAGTLNSGSGYAVLAAQGVTTLTNSGVINGGVKLADGDDTITNTGTFNADRASDFGAGQDRFVNSGALRVGAGASAPIMVGFLGLEHFENAGGLIDMRNGQVGDVLTLPGDYVASGDARLGLDVSKAASDTLVVTGAASGRTAIVLAGVAPDKATLTGGGAALVKVGAGSAPDAFTIANPDAGFIRFALKYDAASGGYVLVGKAGVSVYRAVKFGSAAQDVWDRSAQGWSNHLAALRDARWGGDLSTGRVWGQVFAASDSRDDQRKIIDGAGAATTYDLDYKQDYYGFQFGADLLSKPVGGAGDLVAGVTGGYLKSKLDFARSEQKASFDSFNLGGYASLSGSVFYANGLAQYTHHAVDASDADLGYAGSFKGSTYGARLEAGARVPAGGLVLEPNASITYLHSGLKDLQALGQTLDFDTAEGLKGRLGGRVSGQTQLKSGDHLVFSAGAAVVHAFSDDAGVTLVSGGAREHLDDDRAATYGQGTLGVSLTTKRGFTVYAQGQADRGEGYRSVAGQVGVKVNF
ncbi:MAG: autotransporter domain-containing protein [Caulobacter sp.]|nr:autotransporter domain-containing protein [Caulobacter sp.]